MKSIKLKSLAPLPLAAALAFAGGTAGAQQDELERALRDLNIMSNIFVAALEQEEGSRRFAFGPGQEPEALYLAGQGMVFSFRTAASWYFPQRLGELVGEEMGSFAREMQVFMNDITSAAGDEVEVIVPGVQPALSSGQTRQEREELARLREQAQRLSEQVQRQREEVQRMQREMRALQRQQREDAAAQGRVSQLEESLDAALTDLEEQREAYNRFRQDYDGRRQAALEEYRGRLTSLLATTLCDYGASLRSLEDEQYVTLILEDFGDDRDQVYVFSYAEVAACESADDLLASARSYQL